MKKTLSKLVALATAATLVLGGCSSNTGTSAPSSSGTDSTGSTTTAATTTAPETTPPAASDGDKYEIKDMVTYALQSNEMETFNILQSQSAPTLNVLTNAVEGLLSVDNYGELTPALAETWKSDDGGLTWTFNIRKGVKWVDQKGNEKADCTAQDFVTGLEWILNFHKNMSFNTSMPMELIKGASEYYEYTKGLSEEEGRALDSSKMLEMVGIATPDDYTLVYTCTAPKPYFPTVAAYNCLYPAPKALIDELGVEGFLQMNQETMWYNGCYTITSYIQGNEKVLTKNPAYWDKDCFLFDTVTIKMVESHDNAYQLYQSGELDNVDLTESNLKTIYDTASNEFHDQLVEKQPTKFSYLFHFNYNKLWADGTPDTNWNSAIANEAFRQTWYYGLELTEWLRRTNAINPLKCENNTYTMKGVVYMSDGRDYIDLVEEKLGIGEPNGETMLKYNKDKFEEYKKQAIEELTAKGVTFPIEADYYVASGNQTTLDTATVLKQTFSDCFGDDFVVLNIKTYVSSLTKEVRTPHLQSFVINGWGADYGDPQNYVGQETYGQANAYYSQNYSNIDDVTGEDELIAVYKEFTEMVDAANAINDDMDARYKKYAEAEAFFIQHALAVPCYYDIKWQLTRVNDYSKINGMFGCQNYKYKNWETKKDGYTTAEYDALEAEHASAKTKK